MVETGSIEADERTACQIKRFLFPLFRSCGLHLRNGLLPVSDRRSYLLKRAKHAAPSSSNTCYEELAAPRESGFLSAIGSSNIDECIIITSDVVANANELLDAR